MATKSINVDMLAKMFLAGAQNIEAYGFDFIEGTNIAAADAEIECSVISKSTSDYSEQSDRNALLRFFKYNPDKLDWYTDGDVDVYIDSHSQLRIGDGSIACHAFLDQIAQNAFTDGFFGVVGFQFFHRRSFNSL